MRFVVLRDSFRAGGETFWVGQALTVTGPAGTKTFGFPANLPNKRTAHRRVLVVTPAFAALGLVASDCVVPDGFLPLVNGTVDFADVESVSNAALPTDGAQAPLRSGAPLPAPTTATSSSRRGSRTTSRAAVIAVSTVQW